LPLRWVARFNFSHGTHEDHAKRISLVRAAAEKANKPIALMLDTKGPEMRVGKFAEGKVQLLANQTFTLTARDVLGTEAIVSVNYNNLPREVKPGDRILLADGLISLVVERIEGDDIVTLVQNSGEISNNKRVAVPGVPINLPPVSEQDVADILFGVSQDMDYIAASFIHRGADILAIRKVVEDAGGQMWILAKIESPTGVERIDEILNVADGIMVARGDLGVEIPAEDVPLVQKELIQKCNQSGKPVITATQMLESMINNPRPTRAEASDIANAIMDGTDAIMLSGETASGLYPIEAVEMMAKIAVRTEKVLKYDSMLMQKGISVRLSTTDAVSHATVQLAQELKASAIITATESGSTARMISKYRPQAPIVAVTSSEKTTRFTQLLWGVDPVLGGRFLNSDEMVENSIRSAQKAKAIQDGDLVVITAGVPTGISGTTNMIRVHLVAKVLLTGQGIGKQVVTGKVCVITSSEELQTKYQPGDIMVAVGIDEKSAAYASKAAAIIVEEGGLSSNAAIIGVTYNLPVIVNAPKATGLLEDGMIVTVDPIRGLVYEGEINAR
jgi:pyruvate kinase